MSSLIQTTYDDLVSQMSGKDTLNGWDILVSYSESQINGLLQSQAKAIDGLLTMAPFTATYKDDFGEELEYTVSVNFKNPVIQFQDTSGNVAITMAMAGNYGPKGGTTTHDFAPDILLVLQTTLVSVKGIVDATGNFAADAGSAEPLSKGVLTEPGKLHPVCIDCTKAIATFKSSTGDLSKTQLASLQNIAGTDIQLHFQSQGYKLYLAGMSSNASVVGGSVNLNPQSFRFSIIPGDVTNAIDTTLCMWISVVGGSGNGLDPSHSTSITFRPDSTDLTPIPKGSSASVIFSHDLMANQFFKPGLSYLTGLKCTSVKGTPGMSFTGNFPVGHYKAEGTDRFESWPLGGSRSVHIDPLDFNWSSPSLDIKLLPGILDPSTPSATLAYNAGGAVNTSVHWDITTTAAPSANNPIPQPQTDSGGADMVFKLNGTGQWKTAGTAEGNELGFSIQLDSSFTVTATAESKSIWEQLQSGPGSEVPSTYTSISAAAPSMGAELAPLNYFLATNLLFPGKHVFFADNPVPKAKGDQNGLAMPRDTIITGQIASKIEVAAPVTTGVSMGRRLFVYDTLKPTRVPVFKSGTTTTIEHFSHNAVNGAGNPNTVGDLSLRASSHPELAKKFKDELFATPTAPLLGAIVTSLGDKEHFPDGFLAVMNKFGYSELTSEDYSTILGFPAENVLGVKPHPTLTATSAHAAGDPPPAFDIRLYGAVYNVETPDLEKNKHLIVNPQSGAINYDGADVVYTSETKESHTFVSWKTDKKAFRIEFSSVSSTDTRVEPPVVTFTLKFTGTLAIDGDEKSPYTISGTAYAPRDPWKFWTPGAADITALVGFGIAAISVVSMILACCWRYKDLKDAPANQQAQADAIVKPLRQKMTRDTGRIMHFLSDEAWARITDSDSEKSEEEFIGPSGKAGTFKDLLGKSVNTTIQGEGLSSKVIGKDDPVRGKITEKSKIDVGKGANQYFYQSTGQTMRKAVEPWEQSGFTTTTTTNTTITNKVQEKSDSLVAKLDIPFEGNGGVFTESTAALISDHNSSVLAQQGDKVDGSLTKLEGDMALTATEKQSLETQRQQAEEEADELSGPEKEEKLNEIQRLNDEIEKLNREAEGQVASKEDLEKEKKDVDSEKETELERKREAERKAEEAMKHEH